MDRLINHVIHARRGYEISHLVHCTIMGSAICSTARDVISHVISHVIHYTGCDQSCDPLYGHMLIHVTCHVIHCTVI